jgi:hypothetical protein
MAAAAKVSASKQEGFVRASSYRLFTSGTLSESRRAGNTQYEPRPDRLEVKGLRGEGRAHPNPTGVWDGIGGPQLWPESLPKKAKKGSGAGTLLCWIVAA